MGGPVENSHEATANVGNSAGEASPGDGCAGGKAGSLPIGLTASMVTIAVTLGSMVLFWNQRWLASNPLESIVHVAAGLCLGWGLLAHVLSRLAERPGISARPDLTSVLQITQLLLGLCVAVVMLYVAMTAVLARLYQPHVGVNVWPSGMVDIALVAIAVVLAWWRSGNGMLMTSLMWLLVLMSLWSALQIPALVVREAHGIPIEVPMDWISPFTLGAASVVAALTLLTGLVEHRRRVTAWPDRLDDLVRPAPAWPGFAYGAGIVAAAVLILGCITIVSPLTPPAAMLAGVSMLVLASRRWNESLADAGLGLITLAVVSLLMFTAPDASGRRAEYFAAIFSRVLLGLGIMTLFWHWLAGVWLQQLDNGRAWTTAGRLIRPCQRTGFLLGAIGVLVSAHLAFWPKLPYVYIADNTPGRWIWGIVANLALVLALVRSARKSGKPTLAWLASFALASMVAFILVRLSGTGLYVAVLTYWPLVLAVVAGLLLVLANRLAPTQGGRAFVEPAYVMGALIMPVVAIAGAALSHSLVIPEWVNPATFGLLAVVYCVAALLTGPRRFIVLTAACALAAVWNLQHLW